MSATRRRPLVVCSQDHGRRAQPAEQGQDRHPVGLPLNKYCHWARRCGDGFPHLPQRPGRAAMGLGAAAMASGTPSGRRRPPCGLEESFASSVSSAPLFDVAWRCGDGVPHLPQSLAKRPWGLVPRRWHPPSLAAPHLNSNGARRCGDGVPHLLPRLVWVPACGWEEAFASLMVSPTSRSAASKQPWGAAPRQWRPPPPAAPCSGSGLWLGGGVCVVHVASSATSFAPGTMDRARAQQSRARTGTRLASL